MRRTAITISVLLLLAGCGDTDGDGDADLDPVAAAEQRLTQAEADLADAEGAFEDASDQFCGDAVDYVEAVDRYGRLFTDAEATVGDVTTAGSDLGRPEDKAADSAEAATDAQADLVAAQEAVADAEDQLAEAQTGTTAAPEDEPATEPAVAPVTVERIGEAQSDLDAAFADVDESTTLADAGEQVNAAAVSLQIAWLRVLADAGCLSEEQQAEAVQAVSSYTSALQTALTSAGFYDGPIDGVYGPTTTAAVEELQTASDLPVTGYVDQATAVALEEALAADGAAAGADLVAHTASVQTVLTAAGYWNGPIDGVWTDELTTAIEELQTDLGVPVTGSVDSATLAAAQKAIADAKDAATTTTTTDTDDTTTSTTAP